MIVGCFLLEQIGIACERARLPHLWTEPLALQDAEGAIHVVSDEAAQSGVSAGQPVAGARALYPDLVALPYDRAAYETAARSVWDAIAVYSSTVEPESPETCFAVFDGSDPVGQARRLAQEIAQRVGIPVQVGLGRTKFVARHAAQKDRGHTAFLVPLGEEASFLASLPLACLPGLNRKTWQQLERLDVATLGDILTLPPHRLPKPLRRIGQHLLQWAQGFDSDPVRPLWPPPSLSEEVTFEEETTDRFLVENALLRLAERVACDLAAGQGFCREVRLRVGLADGSCLADTERLALPVSQTPPLFRAAVRLVLRLAIEQSVSTLELTVGDLGTGSGLQLALLDDGGDLPHERKGRLDATLAYLRKRWGTRVVITGSLLRQARRIGLWTFPIGHLVEEPVQVATNHLGTPVRYWRCSRPRGHYNPRRCYEVARVQNRWREAHRHPGGGVLASEDVWRVETDPWGLSELHRLEARWHLAAVMD